MKRNMKMPLRSICLFCKASMLALILSVAIALPAFGQQIPISDMYIVNSKWMNPASVGTSGLNQVFLSHQQRKLAWEGIRSMSQFLNFHSGPLGRSRNFGLGFMVNNDIEHTEQRISVNGAIAVQLVHNQFSQLSVGINAGLINWGSTYRDNRVYDRTDVLISNPTNFSELDAGAGLKYSYTNYFMKSDLNIAASQLPGNLISGSVRGLRLLPHLLAGGSALFSYDNNLYVGPMAFYRNTILGNGEKIQKGTMDVGGKLEVLRWGVWFAGGYRINDAAVTGGFGLKVINPDTLFESSRTAYFLGLNATGSYPLNESSRFGPSFELGLVLSFGQVGESVSRQDTLQQIRGAFWKNEGNINTHKIAKLAANAPPNLKAKTMPEEKSVTLSYSWDDNVYAYVGEHPERVFDTLLSSVGQEWIGIDGILGNIATEVIKEALFPDTLTTQYPDSIERLKDITSIELVGYLKVDELAAGFGAQGAQYAGDLLGRRGQDTLRINIRYAGRDTLVTIKKGEDLSNFQLATLKLHSMRKKLEYEFNKYYGGNFALVWEGESVNDEKTKGRKIVYLKRPEIVVDHPNQKPFMVGQVRVRFTRIPDYFAKREAAKGKGPGGRKPKTKNLEGAKPKGIDAYRVPAGGQL